MITPINKNILVYAEEEKSPFQSREKKYAERGTIVAIAKDCETECKIGDVVSFVSHFAYKIEDDKKVYWFIPHEMVTGIIKNET